MYHILKNNSIYLQILLLKHSVCLLNNSLCLWMTWLSMYDLDITLPRFNIMCVVGKLSPIVCVKYFGYTKTREDVNSATDSASLDCRGKAKLNLV